MHVLQVFSIAPTLESEELPTQTSLPLTFFDILWLRSPPIQRILFYQFSHPTPPFFHTLLPKLIHSLSLTLGHFFPLAGHLTWPLHSQNPIINYKTGDSVSLTAAESDADFNHLAGSNLWKTEEMHHLLPHLNISHEQATLLALQITLFPNSGFSIGITSHRAVLDAKTSTSFIKSWAYLCRESRAPPCLPPELCPFYERILVKDPDQIGEKFLNDWLMQGGSNKRSLMVRDVQSPEHATGGLFKLSGSDIERLKHFVVSKQRQNNINIHLSTFVLSLAYAWVCRVRAEEMKNERVTLILTVDCRGCLEPPLPPTYFGNCVGLRLAIAERRELLGEDGLIVAVEALSEAMESVKKEGVLIGAENWSSWLLDCVGGEADVKAIGVAGSPNFEAYSSDFGWGGPKKVETVSIERTAVFSLSDSNNGEGIEIGFVSKKTTMETFASLFAKGLQS
ncbi:hypothetical protein LR48_Vigan03g017900 [Vigna angularis]|uniref:Phenolic glucoside malonyltransferase n=2 Tax=Phaseolus angularis TaxID=3914 RepID=A0A0L9U1U5_PHAAN|nr:phenolic glucoside malonyltransferase 2 [Vigna angularis]KAG2404005.1 Phenolic glucoside malonyltransferase [Vigna angularis]KOM36798.1 hypothetical protein LR48_Vigan03g017900 [Vigna angularis]BAT83273.1 hypothetical protein VIGAN_04039900 [Vigna angularis var. angularis]